MASSHQHDVLVIWKGVRDQMKLGRWPGFGKPLEVGKRRRGEDEYHNENEVGATDDDENEDDDNDEAELVIV